MSDRTRAKVLIVFLLTVTGINTKEGKQISYHLPMEKWNLLESYERNQAPKWDGHTPADVVERLLKL